MSTFISYFSPALYLNSLPMLFTLIQNGLASQYSTNNLPSSQPLERRKIKYGCPLLPLLIPSPPGILPADGLSPPEFTAKIASLLRSAILPDPIRTGAALVQKWNKIDLEGIRALDDSLNPVIWPSPTTPAFSPTPSGMSFVSIYISYLFDFFLSPPPPPLFFH